MSPARPALDVAELELVKLQRVRAVLASGGHKESELHSLVVGAISGIAWMVGRDNDSPTETIQKLIAKKGGAR